MHFLTPLLLLYASTGLWAESEILRPWFQVAVGFLLAIAPFLVREEKLTLPKLESKPLWFFLALLPSTVYLGLTFFREFPFCCDYAWHISAGVEWANFWKKNFLFPFLWSVFYLFRISRYKWGHLVFFFGLQVLGLSSEMGASGFRYPALVYFLEVPWMALSLKLGKYIELPSRINSLLSILFWILATQFIVNSRRRLGVLLFILFFFFQKETLSYFTASYLEPWGIVLTLLAFDCLYEKKFNWALLFLAMASVAKEYCVFLFPLLWFPIIVKERKDFLSWFLKGCLAVFPFLTFVLLRGKGTDPRPVELLLHPWNVSPQFWSDWKNEILFQYGLGGTFIILASSVLVLLCLIRFLRSKNRTWEEALISIVFPSCALSVFALFFFDKETASGFAAMARFNFLPFGFLSLSASKILNAKWENKSLASKITVCALVLMLQLTVTGPFLWKARLPSYEQSAQGNESKTQKEKPYFFPIRQLIQGAEKKGWVRGGDVIHIETKEARENGTFGFTPFPFYYRELNHFQLEDGPPYDCNCKRPKIKALLATILYVPMQKGTPLFERREKLISDCYEKLLTTCQHVDRALSSTGDLIGVIGISPE